MQIQRIVYTLSRAAVAVLRISEGGGRGWSPCLANSTDSTRGIWHESRESVSGWMDHLTHAGFLVNQQLPKKQESERAEEEAFRFRVFSSRRRPCRRLRSAQTKPPKALAEPACESSLSIHGMGCTGKKAMKNARATKTFNASTFVPYLAGSSLHVKANPSAMKGSV